MDANHIASRRQSSLTRWVIAAVVLTACSSSTDAAPSATTLGVTTSVASAPASTTGTNPTTLIEPRPPTASTEPAVASTVASSTSTTAVVLDFEFKTMEPGWPMRRSGAAEPSRLVVRQVRSLDPGMRHLPSGIRALDVPRDLLARARRVERIVCRGSESVEVWSDPRVVPDMGFASRPWSSGDVDTTGCSRSTLYRSPDEQLVALAASGAPLLATVAPQ